MKNVGYLLIVALLGFVACDKNNDEEFDRSKMVTNIGSNIIQNALNDYQGKLNGFTASSNAFINSPSSSSLTVVKEDFKQLYLSFQGIKMFNFGKLEDYNYPGLTNIYPCDTGKIEDNILAGSIAVSTSSNTDAVGLPALDYLLYHNAASAIITEFTGAENEGRRTYFSALIDKLNTEFTLVSNTWNNTYKTEFLASTGIDMGSSTGMFYNAYLKDVELLKNAKIGIPAGQQTGGLTFPSYVEGYYSELSNELAIESITQLKNIFNGGTGIGFDDYIKHVEGEDSESSIVDVINNQFDAVINGLKNLNNPLSVEVDDNFTGVNQIYSDIKTLVTYLKTDASSLMGILITYQDNDGD